ncbi:MAG: hypothetical protein ACU837_07905 [Gammaproteobacteria bacterium]
MNLARATRFIESLNEHNIEYCHWKSNVSLANALAGEEDLDILVDRKTLPKMAIIFAELGFKPAVIKSGPNVPGIFHYYGLDAQTGKICHVHLFSSVLTGESFVKSHLLPIERMLLENTDYIGPAKVVSKSAELVLFVLRTFIKYGSLPDLRRLAGHEDAVRDELHWLQSGADLSLSLALLNKYCPVLDDVLFLQCIETLDGAGNLMKRMALAYTVRQRLRIYAKYTPLKRLFAYAQFALTKQRQRLTGNRKNKTLHSGGAIIAFTGADATGKSTLVARTGQWLGQVFCVRTVHVGKPPSTWLTMPLNLLVPRMRRLVPQLRRSGVGRAEVATMVAVRAQPGPALHSLLYAVRAAALAWDRYSLLIKVRRWAANGEIVVCDRYPTETVRAMDSPRLQENPHCTGFKAAVYNSLARFENRLYRQMPPPDVVLKLKVSLATAQQRNRNRKDVGSDAEEFIAARHRGNHEWYRHGTKYYYAIDTEMSLEDTVASVKKALWDAL